MAFIPDTERLIYFDLPTREHKLLPVDDLKSLREAGIGTMLASGSDWSKFEQVMGKRDYTSLDETIARARSAGMRVLLPLWQFVSVNLPKHWYAQTITGSIPAGPAGPEYLLSPWNLEAQDYALSVMREIITHYRAADVQIIPSLSRHGESVMPVDARYYDPAARAAWKAAGLPHDTPDQNLPGGAEWIKAAYLRLVTHQQKLCSTQHNEAWFMLHLPKQGRVNCGCDWIEDYIRALPGVQVNHITFTYFANYPGLPEKIARLRIVYDTREWVGAEYAEGLRDGNAEKARALNLRGCVIAPCHPFTTHTRVMPWMLAEIRKAAR